MLDIELPITIKPQPDDTTCGPTCLHAVYKYYGDEASLQEVIGSTNRLDAGGTLAVFLANAAIRRGYKTTIYTYDLQMFDPSWFDSKKIDISERLRRQAELKDDAKLRYATDGFLEFLSLGGKLRFTDLNPRLIRGILGKQLPILTGLSCTYLYHSPRVYGDDDHYDDLRGNPSGHFVILAGYHRKHRTVLVADPYLLNPVADGQFYEVNIDRVICSIMLGILTYDANLLVIHPKR